jgi:hypothetical protein
MFRLIQVGHRCTKLKWSREKHIGFYRMLHSSVLPKCIELAIAFSAYRT